MDKRSFSSCKLDFHGNNSCSVPSVSPPLLLSEEARHLVYVFCERGENSIKSQKHSYQRRYCSLCRHFHQQTPYKDGIEKYYFPQVSPKNINSGKNLRNKVDLISNGDTVGLQENGALLAEEENLRSLSVEGLKMYKKSSKTSHKLISTKSEARKEGNLHGNKETDKKKSSARSGCKVCVKRRDSDDETNLKSKKKIIKVVVPPFE